MVLYLQRLVFRYYNINLLLLKPVMVVHQNRRSMQLTIRLVYWHRWSCVFLYLRHEDATLAILCTDLPINTTIVGNDPSLNSLRFHDNIKCITTNGQTMIYVGTNWICHMTICCAKKLGSVKSFLICAYSLGHCD